MMSECKPYELIDFGDGRKLEQFGRYLIDRPCPTAQDVRRRAPSRWAAVDARYERTDAGGGDWVLGEGVRERWHVELGSLHLELRATASGQVGFFPEQIDNWAWLADRLNRPGKRSAVLNLFAYTGGSSLSAAAAGAEVVHVDSSKSAVSWARRNAKLSGLGNAPIRWIVEDAATFVRRELRRENRYDGIILDPPSYGHGPRGETWKVDRHLPGLLADCAQLVRGDRPLLLLTCHTCGFCSDTLRGMLSESFPCCAPDLLMNRPLQIRTEDGRQMASGAVARWPG